jgi:hypothetical protein
MNTHNVTSEAVDCVERTMFGEQVEMCVAILSNLPIDQMRKVARQLNQSTLSILRQALDESGQW